MLPEAIRTVLAGRAGHFRYESGHHGDRWLDLECLFASPHAMQPCIAALAARLAPHRVECVCGPLVEGAFVALQVAAELRLPFAYTERIVDEDAAAAGDLYPVRYRVPAALRPDLDGRRLAVVNDVINAGSAAGGTLTDVRACGGRPVVLAALQVRGDAAADLASVHGAAVEVLTTAAQHMWPPQACPLCAAGVPLDAAR